MPEFLDPRDRRLVTGALGVMILLLGVVYALWPSPAQQPGRFPSSYSPDWAGSKAAFLLLGKLGYRETRWESPPEELPAQAAGTTLIFAQPFASASIADRAAVTRFVSSGGRLLVTGATGATLAPRGNAAAVVSWNLEPRTYDALVPSPLIREADEITMIAPDRWTSTAQPQLPIFGSSDNPVVVWYRVGKGQVIWWASSSPLANGSIREKGNLALFLNSVGPPDSRVLWDEYFHGMRRSLSSYFLGTSMPWAGLQIALFMAALLFTFARRSGPIWAPTDESRMSPLEFVGTLGDLYRSAHAAPAAVEVTYQRFRLSLSRKLRMPAKTRLPELCRAAAARFGWTEQTLLGTLTHAERAMRNIRLEDGEALTLVQELHDALEVLEPHRESVEEKPTWK